MEKNLLNEIKKSISYRFNLDDDKATEAEMLENIKKGIEFKGINIWTLIFAILIASIGLNVNSTAVIIGAMLISPLMSPIMGIGMGAGIFDFELIKKSAKNLLIATFVGLISSTFYFFISPLSTAQSELLARTTPTIYDVLIAFIGGLAGIVASSRKKYNNVIPGVAIATALMPPLCTAGFGIATGQWSYFFGAFYLFLINSVFISIATFIIVRFLKFQPASYVNPEMAGRIKKWVITIAVLTIIPSVFLAHYFINNEIFVQNANRFLTEEFSHSNYLLVSKSINPEEKEIVLSIIGNESNDTLSSLLEKRKEAYHLQDARIVLKNGIDAKKNGQDISNLKESLVGELLSKQEAMIRTKTEELLAIKKQLHNKEEFDIKKKKAIEEFHALYGIPKELIIEEIINHLKEQADTTLLVVIKPDSKMQRRLEMEKLRQWMSVKFDIKAVKIIHER